MVVILLQYGNIVIVVILISDVLLNLFIYFAVVSAPCLISSYLVEEITMLRISSQS